MSILQHLLTLGEILQKRGEELLRASGSVDSATAPVFQKVTQTFVFALS